MLVCFSARLVDVPDAPERLVTPELRGGLASHCYRKRLVTQIYGRRRSFAPKLAEKM